ncbi:serine phosphatase RsbU (regulator of sigma subunit) [Streptomyces luteogriseus]|uniref:Serine phosphatase RsbU (Regulator of sigma subunit) n=1 Tax=Streptomyces luteogriseus TaxID=68233 RepID=A0A7W7GLN4_9ACTN|nr:PP2C family protein-serine/threonine phosphatase [Streptomyces luteogriseus]MBB4716300.1 serine phosphatase RsbU (regulator of sigma subunit) [Streptomyces luteogriseus]
MTSSPARPRPGAVSTVSAASAPCPVVVLDADGHIAELNDAAGALLPTARVGRPLSSPAWLATADRARPVPVSGVVGDRSFSAHPSVTAGARTVWWLMEETAYRSARGELEAERGRTRFLTDASSALLASLNLERCMEVTARLATEHLADAALVIAPTAARALPVVAFDHRGELTRSTAPEAPESVPGLAEALRGFPPVPSRWIDPATAPDWLIPAGFGEVGSLVITPLPGLGVPAGALILLRRAQQDAFTEAEESLAGLFAARAGAAMSAARLYAEQNSISDTLMRELLPPTLRQTEGVEFAGGYRASKDTERVGGDFYDVHPPGEDSPETLVVLGDVAGKGLEAAVLTGKIRNTLHALLPMADDHAKLLRLVNNAMRSSHHTRFATLVMASVRREEREVSLRLTSAGHPAPLIIRRDGTVEEADTGGTLIGVLPTITSRTARVRLAPGETCLLFTDGVTEARGGPLGDTMFGDQRLKRAAAECAGLPAEAVVERVQMVTSQWIGDGRHDDIAVLAITAPRGAHLSAVDGATRGRYTA